MDGICVSMLGQLKFLLQMKLQPFFKIFSFFYSSLSGVGQLTLSWILQVAAPHFLKNCLVGWKFLRLNPGNGDIMTFTNDSKDTKWSPKVLSLGMDMIQIRTFMPCFYYDSQSFLHLPLPKQPATGGNNCLEIFNVCKAPFCIEKQAFGSCVIDEQRNR